MARHFGGIAQLVERIHGMDEVVSSSLSASTLFKTRESLAGLERFEARTSTLSH